ncbi:MAG: tetratricopeptide repeat protein [Blastocatellia bacterium]
MPERNPDRSKETPTEKRPPTQELPPFPPSVPSGRLNVNAGPPVREPVNGPEAEVRSAAGKEAEDQPPPRSEARSDAGPETGKNGEPPTDPVAISESLRRLRQSGPLIIEAVKDKQDRFNEIISQAVESMNEPGKASRAVGTNGGAQERPMDSRGPAPTGSTGGLPSRLQSAAQSAANKVAIVAGATQSTVRRTTGPLSAGGNSASSTAMRSSAGSFAGGATAMPPNGPSTVLVQASGLKPQSFGSKFRAGLIILAVLVATGIYFIIRDNLLLARRPAETERNLVGAEEQSAQYVRLGQQQREQGNYDAAQAYLQQALLMMPNNQYARFQLAQTYLNAGQTDQSLKAFQALLRGAPENLEARLQIAEIHRNRGNWSAAYQEYQRIIAMDSNSGQAQVALAEIEKYQAAHPDSPGPLVIAKIGRRPSKPAKSAPVLPVASGSSTQIAMAPQRTTPAPNAKPPASLNVPRAEDAPDPLALADTHKKLGVRYLNVREFRAAISEFLTALRLTPEDKDLYYFLGSSYYGLNQPAEAYNYYRRVDRGPYVGPAQSGTRLTEKAAREELKRRGQIQNETNTSSIGDKSGKPGQNSLEE